MSRWAGLGISPARFLLPKKEHLNHFWGVVALDQYTSQKEVWLRAGEEVGEHPSTLRLIVPEAFLDEAERRSQAVYRAMEDYLARDLFDAYPDSFVLVERQTQSGKRVGLVLCIDLEEYEYDPKSQALIRATEETVLSRIPPRLKVREQSKLEMSHVLLLVDDPTDSLMGPLYEKRDSLPLLYDLDLLMNGGHIRGWQVKEDGDHERLAAALRKLKDKVQNQGMLFAVGDGNHSLAAAKASWDKQKRHLSKQEQEAHPARFACAELINLHSEALLFEPIHRLAFGTDAGAVLAALEGLKPENTQEEPDLVLITGESERALKLSVPDGALVTALVQTALDEAGFDLDYIHGADTLRDLVKKEQAVGLLMPDFPKDRLFPTVEKDGKLPRKTFSMGEANEKRYYMETRTI
ncbi:MAG: DUF1015 domain-containing protein [Clostridiales bacterium]|nr:DUF1015 domain-containing protein [Clostridiales bacterium]